MILKTELNSLTRGELLNLNKYLKTACNKVVGKNKSVYVRTYPVYNESCIAFYEDEDNSIHIYRKNLKTVEQYVKTFIHEWKHSCQKGIKNRYNKMAKEYGYWNNPYEIEAREAEKIHKSDVWKIVKRLMKK